MNGVKYKRMRLRGKLIWNKLRSIEDASNIIFFFTNLR